VASLPISILLVLLLPLPPPGWRLRITLSEEMLSSELTTLNLTFCIPKPFWALGRDSVIDEMYLTESQSSSSAQPRKWKGNVSFLLTSLNLIFCTPKPFWALSRDSVIGKMYLTKIHSSSSAQRGKWKGNISFKLSSNARFPFAYDIRALLSLLQIGRLVELGTLCSIQ